MNKEEDKKWCEELIESKPWMIGYPHKVYDASHMCFAWKELTAKQIAEDRALNLPGGICYDSTEWHTYWAEHADQQKANIARYLKSKA